MTTNPIICAVDTMDVGRARIFSDQLEGHVGALKLGLEFFTANGAAGVREIASEQAPVFLDLKFHDIPNTVSKAIKATAGLDTFMMTIHTAGGLEMMRAAVEASSENAAKTGKPRAMIVGVTILTSLDQQDVHAVGVNDTISDQVKRLASLAQQAGLDGVVCSPLEIDMLRATCGRDFTLVVPGIRPEGSSSGDQKRVMTPKEALAKGADYLVIGRPITQASDPAQAARDILN